MRMLPAPSHGFQLFFASHEVIHFGAVLLGCESAAGFIIHGGAGETGALLVRQIAKRCRGLGGCLHEFGQIGNAGVVEFRQRGRDVVGFGVGHAINLA